MAARTNDTAVKELLGFNYAVSRSPSVTPYIDTASSNVDDLVAAVADRGLAALAAPKLELIERWLACYWYTQMDPLYSARGNLGASGSFRDADYLKAALALDPYGLLKTIVSGDKKTFVGGEWLGKPVGEQRTSEERNAV